MELRELGGAAWVWTASARPQQYVALRLTVEHAGEMPAAVPVHVSAGNLYRLYVNGRAVGRGPVREWAGHAGLDTWDIAPWLRAGANVISALVLYYGEDVGGCQLTPPGFLLAGALGGASLATGVAAWEVRELDAWDAAAPRISLYNGFNEWVDLDRWQPAVWEQGADAAGWGPAAPVPEAATQRPTLEARLIPPLAETLMPPMSLIRTAGNRLLFAAERMVSGTLEIELTAPAPLTLEIRYGDRLEDGVFVGDHGGVNLQLDRLRMPAGRQRWAGAFVLRGFRYVELAWEGAAPADLCPRPREVIYPVAHRARFESSDPWLNRCWREARLTVHLCMADTYMDNPSRERQQYGGDGYLQALYGFELFGDLALWRQFLRHYAQGRRADGAHQSGGPWCWNQIIPAWTLLWIEAIGEYRRQTRDPAIAGEYAAAILEALAWFEPMLGDDGLLHVAERFKYGPGGDVLWNFIDWQTGQGDLTQLTGEAARLTLNGLYVMALDTAAELLAADRPAAAAALSARRREVADRLAAHPGLEEHALVAATLAGVVNGRLAPVVEAVRGQRARTDIMYLFFTLKALVQEDQPEAAMTLLRDIFTPMLDAAHGTFWEARQVPPGSSRAICQAIGGAPAYWLPRLVAGIRRIDAAERCVTFGRPLPEVAAAHIVLPCVDGDIEIDTKAGDITRLRLPEGWRHDGGNA